MTLSLSLSRLLNLVLSPADTTGTSFSSVTAEVETCLNQLILILQLHSVDRNFTVLQSRSITENSDTKDMKDNKFLHKNVHREYLTETLSPCYTHLWQYAFLIFFFTLCSQYQIWAMLNFIISNSRKGIALSEERQSTRDIPTDSLYQ